MDAHKKGSRIQRASRNYQESLKKDGYKCYGLISLNTGERLGWTFTQMPFAACFVTTFEPNRNKWVPELLQEGTHIVGRHKNIFVSTDEIF